jgi:hypothetical protein
MGRVLQGFSRECSSPLTPYANYAIYKSLADYFPVNEGGKMFFKKFMEEVDAIEATGEFKDPATVEATEEEEVIGSIADNPYFKALCTAIENRAKIFIEKLPQMTEDQERRAGKEFDAITGMLWIELRFYFNVLKDAITLRKGWTVVKDKQPASQVLEVILPSMIREALNADCGNPNCSVCGGGIGRAMRQRPIAEA